MSSAATPRRAVPGNWETAPTGDPHPRGVQPVVPAPYPPPGAGTQPRAWMRYAICRNENTDLFYPLTTTGPGLEQAAEAKQVCGLCPVQTHCLNHALTTGEQHGIWGGLSEVERAQLRIEEAA